MSFIIGFDVFGFVCFDSNLFSLKIISIFAKFFKIFLLWINEASSVGILSASFYISFVGKTWFLYYIMARLAKMQNVTILFQNAVDRGYLFSPYGVQLGSLSRLLELLPQDRTNPNVYYLVDGVPPDSLVLEAVATSILVSSPDKKTYTAFNKLLSDEETIRYMPIWSWEEINRTRQLIFKHLHLDLVVDLYNKFGGIPRYVLQKARSDPVRELQKVIASSTLDQLIASIGQIAEKEGTSHRVLHIVVDEDDGYYNDTTIKFASVWVAEQVAEQFFVNEKQRFLTFLASSAGAGESAALKGILFEGYMHNLFKAGGRFEQAELLTDGTRLPSMLDLKARKECIFKSRDEIKNLTENEYARPLSKSFAVIDSLISPHYLFQSTVSEHHPIKMQRLVDIITALPPSTNPIYLCFVVPEDIFTQFRLQNYETTEGKVAKQLHPTISSRVRQFVVKIRLTSSETVQSTTVSTTGAAKRQREEASEALTQIEPPLPQEPPVKIQKSD